MAAWAPLNNVKITTSRKVFRVEIKILIPVLTSMGSRNLCPEPTLMDDSWMIDCALASTAHEVYSKMPQNNPVDLPRLPLVFLSSAPNLRTCPAVAGPEIAIAGRSNAGKSSVINRLTGNRQTAKVSKTPGRTRLLNFFERPNGDRLVDLPGYGYAKAERQAQADWQAAVNTYLSRRDSLVGIILVMDIRHPLQPFDIAMLGWGEDSNLPVHVLLNKADKLGQATRMATLQQVRKVLTARRLITLQVFSAQTGLGLQTLLDRLETLWQMNTLQSPDAELDESNKTNQAAVALSPEDSR